MGWLLLAERPEERSPSVSGERQGPAVAVSGVPHGDSFGAGYFYALAAVRVAVGRGSPVVHTSPSHSIMAALSEAR